MMPHDVPTASELTEAVREWLEGVAESGEPPNRFHARVASNMLAMVERELKLGEEHRRRHIARLDQLGMADEVELAAAVRAGRLDADLDQVRALVWESVRDKLEVANPSYVEQRREP